MKFRLLGQDVAISEAAESYNTYRKLFIGQAKTAANQFFDTYERNQSLEDVVRKTPDQIAACIAPSVELCIQILVDHGVYTIDREQFSSTYRSYLDRWKKAYEAICDQYDSIVSEQEELDQYRVARRENRGRWVGGGFGIGGAQCFQRGLHGLGRVAAHFHQRRLEGFQIGVVLFTDTHSCFLL